MFRLDEWSAVLQSMRSRTECSAAEHALKDGHESFPLVLQSMAAGVLRRADATKFASSASEHGGKNSCADA